MSQQIFSIPPHENFLQKLVEGVIDGSLLGDWERSGPFWLSDVTIILPTRRARLALSSAFAMAMGGQTLLPDIRTLGVEDDEENAFNLAEHDQKQFPAIAEFDRRFLLCTLVEQWLKNRELVNQKTAINGDVANSNAINIDGAKIIGLADSLAKLIDDIIIEEIDPNAIRALPELELDAQKYQDLARNFEQNLEFLEIALTAWPQILQERSQIDPSAEKVAKAAKQSQNLAKTFGGRPVIAAGSTGSVAATAKLLKAVVGLKRGFLVLPGLDINLSEVEQEKLLDLANSPHGHPQYGMCQLLKRLKTTPDTVVELATKKSVRTNLVRDALILASDTSQWNALRARYTDSEVKKTTADIALIKAKTEQEQALAIAIAAQNGLANNQSVGIITPDRNFARRITAELKRFDIHVDDSAGTPLFQSEAGRFARQILGAAQNKFSAVDLMALLRNGSFFIGQERVNILNIADLIEFALLRGQRPASGITGLHSILKQNLSGELPRTSHKLSSDEAEKITNLLNAIDEVFFDLCKLLEKPNFYAQALAKTLIATLEKLFCPPSDNVTSLKGYPEIKVWAQKLGNTKILGPGISSNSADALLRALMQNVSVRQQNTDLNIMGGTGSISIWGRLEARLQSRDLMIICTLNEGIWPQIADPGPWLSRSMRLNAGLEPPERMHGLAAHDFEMALGNPNIILSYSTRIGSSPALPSRLLERFLAFVGNATKEEMQKRGNKWLQGARNLDWAGPAKPAMRPAPSPPAKLRPKSISITEVETLIRSPYDLYAKYVLGLKSIDPLGQEIGNRERGTLVHEVFAKFIEQRHDINDKNAPNILDEIAAKVFAVLDGQPDQRDIWLKRFHKSAHGFLEFERLRDKEIKTRFAEINLKWKNPVNGFELRGRADRIDVRHDGLLEILDFKTGSVPTKAEMKEFMAPQMLIEAAIAKQVGFESHSPAPVKEASYIKIALGPLAFKLHPFETPPGMDIDEAAQQILQMVQLRAEVFLYSDDAIMSPRIIPKSNQRFTSTYEHLARTAEWTQVEADEMGGES
ncbi:MAG: double-strand break repair protein AddB [Devosiaceae bacterium]|nr:double-strand break repair protein AddB [Devosiaceae bacterium]